MHAPARQRAAFPRISSNPAFLRFATRGTMPRARTSAAASGFPTNFLERHATRSPYRPPPSPSGARSDERSRASGTASDRAVNARPRSFSLRHRGLGSPSRPSPRGGDVGETFTPQLFNPPTFFRTDSAIHRSNRMTPAKSSEIQSRNCLTCS
jgi:hypothetical protein